MRITIIIKTTLTFLLFTAIQHSYAQDTLSNKHDSSVNNFPKAVLVQLRSEHNRIAAATKAGGYKDVAEIKKDALAIQNAMINDFHDHFTNCPVYYYMDTNADLIQKKIFKGILLNAGLVPVEDLPLSDTDTNYLVVYYGYPTRQSATRQVVPSTTRGRVYIDPPGIRKIITDTMNYRYNSGGPQGIGLIVMNDEFLQVNYFYKFGYDELALNRHVSKKYRYSSKHFQMEYYPFAGLFNTKLTDRGGNHRIPINFKKEKPE